VLPRSQSRHPDGDLPGQHCGFLSDNAATLGISLIPQAEWPALINDIGDGLKQNSNWAYDQGQVGSCASEGANGLVDVIRDREGQPKVRFNPYGTYQENDVSGGRDQGSTLGDNMRSVRIRGCHPASLHPRSLGWRARPSAASYAAALHYRVDEYYEIRNWTEMGSALLQGFCVFTAYPGHAWIMLALKNIQQGLWRNSWSEQWGDGGYGIINASRLQINYGAYCCRTTIDSGGR